MKSRRILLVGICLLLAAILIIPLVAHAAVDDSYSVVLLHMNGNDGSQVFTDESGKTWTSHNSAQIDTDQHAFGNASGLFGTSRYLTTPDSEDFNFGTGDFSIDFWARFTSMPGTDAAEIFYTQGTDANNRIFLALDKNGGNLHLNFTVINSSTTVISMINSWGPDINVWYHVALTRSGNNTRYFVNGNQLGSTDTSSYTVNNYTGEGIIGARYSKDMHFMLGWLDEFRISKGIARWTSNFSLPDAEYGPTPTPTNTPTDTATATETPTPTNTSAFTATYTSTYTPTFTPTNTLTATYTPTVSLTPTPSVTPTPGTSVIWADGPVTLSTALQTAIGHLLVFRVPPDATTNVYAVTNISGVDTAWNISIVNLVDVSAPYTTWSQETNVDWAWFVQCVGSEPTWSCDYYTLPAGGGGGSMRWPWKTGYSAQYGIMGVHAGAQMIPGSSAIDLLGRDSDQGSMPPQVIAAADGIITSVCSDGTTMAIRVDGGPVPLAYFHFDTGQTFAEGQTVTQGEVLGQLRYGSFIGSNCGYAIQQSDQYHIHFVFLPTSPGYFEIGGCVLDMSTRAIVCNGHTYGTLDYIPNGGGTSNPNNPTPVPGENPPSFGGGAHLWDGIVDMIVQLSSNTLNQYLPKQIPVFGYVLGKVELVMESLISIFMAFFMTGLSGSYILIILLAIITLELTYLAGSILLTVAKWII